MLPAKLCRLADSSHGSGEALAKQEGAIGSWTIPEIRYYALYTTNIGPKGQRPKPSETAAWSRIASNIDNPSFRAFEALLGETLVGA